MSERLLHPPSFLDAVIAISKRKDLSLCRDERELTGMYHSICVYKTLPKAIEGIPKQFVGKLRWPKDGLPADVDPELMAELMFGGPRNVA